MNIYNPLVILNTDASWDSKTKLGTWAYWIQINDLDFKDSGIFPKEIPHSVIAELLTAEKALRRAEYEMELLGLPIRRMKLYTDCKFVIQALDGNVKRSQHAMLCRAVRHAFSKYTVQKTHVKAHNNTRTESYRINDWCDREARKLLREELGRQ